MANIIIVIIGFALWFYAGYKVGKMTELKNQIKKRNKLY
jgi:hypothetical protein